VILVFSDTAQISVIETLDAEEDSDAAKSGTPTISDSLERRLLSKWQTYDRRGS
jgi:hypothetical protein